jgi:hypothetical protein
MRFLKQKVAVRLLSVVIELHSCYQPLASYDRG